MIAEAVDTALLVIRGAIACAGAAGGVVALALLIVIWTGLPLGIWARLPRLRRRPRSQPDRPRPTWSKQ